MQHLLDDQQQAIIPIAAFTASGDMEKLTIALHKGLDALLTINEIKEVLVQLYAYAGFPRSLNALGILMSVVEQRQQQGFKDEVGKEATALSADSDSLVTGTDNQTQLVGKPVSGALFEFAPAIDQFLKAHLFGDIFNRDTLSWQIRELATISALAALSGVNSQLKSHYSISLKNGLNVQQLRAFVDVLKLQCGADVATNAGAVLDEVV